MTIYKDIRKIYELINGLIDCINPSSKYYEECIVIRDKCLDIISELQRDNLNF